ncbi:hypothetical protein MMC07_003789 [Pseudocyphellaria aurata]|nr:hypothetical protein [Pseudocyphellaria aurata]
MGRLITPQAIMCQITLNQFIMGQDTPDQAFKGQATLDHTTLDQATLNQAIKGQDTSNQASLVQVIMGQALISLEQDEMDRLIIPQAIMGNAHGNPLGATGTRGLSGGSGPEMETTRPQPDVLDDSDEDSFSEDGDFSS